MMMESNLKVFVVVLIVFIVVVQQSVCMPLNQLNVDANANANKLLSSDTNHHAVQQQQQQNLVVESKPNKRMERSIIPSMNGKIPSMLREMKRDVNNQEDFEDESNNNNVDPVYYPMLISKKSATALNKLIYALKTSLDSGSLEQDTARFPYSTSSKYVRNIQSYDPQYTHLQRRGQQKDRKNYLRCYFNAVSCF